MHCFCSAAPTCKTCRKWPRTSTTRTSARSVWSVAAGCPPMVTFCLCLLRTYLSVCLLPVCPPAPPPTSNRKPHVYSSRALPIGQQIGGGVTRWEIGVRHMLQWTGNWPAANRTGSVDLFELHTCHTPISPRIRRLCPTPFSLLDPPEDFEMRCCRHVPDDVTRYFCCRGNLTLDMFRDMSQAVAALLFWGKTMNRIM